jgi:hypothetical protein
MALSNLPLALFRPRVSSSFRLPSVDSAGALSAGLCAVHCVTSSVWLAVLPSVGLGLLLDPRLERLFLWSAVALGAVAFSQGWMRHRRLVPVVLFAAALGVLLLWRPRLAEGSTGELLAVVLGAATLISAHWQNARWLRGRACEHSA